MLCLPTTRTHVTRRHASISTLICVNATHASCPSKYSMFRGDAPVNILILLKICYITGNGTRDGQCMSALPDSKTPTFQQYPTPLNVNHVALDFSKQHARKAAAKPVLHTQPRSEAALYTRGNVYTAHTTDGYSIGTLESLGMIFLGLVKVKTS